MRLDTIRPTLPGPVPDKRRHEVLRWWAAPDVKSVPPESVDASTSQSGIVPSTVRDVIADVLRVEPSTLGVPDGGGLKSVQVDRVAKNRGCGPPRDWLPSHSTVV